MPDGNLVSCISCQVDQGILQPTGGFVHEDSLWTANHLLGSNAWPGWLVLQPRRHVEAFHELSPEEAEGFASVFSILDKALRNVLKAEKVYLSLFAEAADCPHIHFHIIPRYAETPARGPGVFQLDPELRPSATVQEVLEIVRRLREYLNDQSGND